MDYHNREESNDHDSIGSAGLSEAGIIDYACLGSATLLPVHPDRVTLWDGTVIRFTSAPPI